MQVTLATVHEHRHRVLLLLLLQLILHLVLYLFNILHSEQVRQLAHVQDTVDIFDEHFIFDILVRQAENDLLVVDSQRLIQSSQVFPPLIHSVLLM